MPSVRIDIDGQGIGDLLASAEVQDMLMDRAERVAGAARAAGIMVEDDTVPLPVEVIDAGSADRARALVKVDHPAGLAVEAKHRLLGRSVDAAR